MGAGDDKTKKSNKKKSDNNSSSAAGKHSEPIPNGADGARPHKPHRLLALCCGSRSGDQS